MNEPENTPTQPDIPPDTGPTEPDLTPPQEAAAAPRSAPKPEEKEKEVELEPAYKTDPRNEIYAKRSRDLEAQQGQDEGVFPPMTGPEDEPGDELPAEPEKPVIASGGKSVKINVYGEEREVPESEVIRAGVATLQKDAAADIRLRNAAQKEAELKRQEEALLRASENLRKGLDVNGQPLATTPHLPAKGVAGSRTISKEAMEQLADETVKALYSGDADEAKKALMAYTGQLQQAQSQQSHVDPAIVKSVEDAVLANIQTRQAAERDEQDRLEANRIFREDFRDISSDPDTFAMARGLVARLASDPEWQSRSRAEVAREVGNRIRKLSGQPSGDPLEARRGTKRNLPTQPQATGRTPAPQPQRFPSNTDYIQQLRANSGSNSVR